MFTTRIKHPSLRFLKYINPQKLGVQRELSELGSTLESDRDGYEISDGLCIRPF